MATQVDDDAGAERFTGHAGTGSPRDQSNLVLRRVANHRLHIFFIAGNDHAKRLDLENAGIGAVQSPRQLIEEKLPFDQTFQIVLDVFALWFVHGFA
jgi:hypothetical protein